MTLVALVDRCWGIAKNGKQIRFIPDDLKRFSRITMGGTVIMGRKTFEAIGHPLPGRRNMILSQNPGFAPEGAEVFRKLEELLEALPGTAFVISGASVYDQLLPYCDTALITMTNEDFGADKFILNLGMDWALRGTSKTMECDGLRYQFHRYERGEVLP